jgi:uncharacterized protein
VLRGSDRLLPYTAVCPNRLSYLRPRLLIRMDIFSKTSGTLVNVLTVVVGTLIGLAVAGRLSDRTSRTLLQVLSLITASIGLGMAGELGNVKAGSVPGIILALVALAVGAVIGEALKLEDRLESLGDWMKNRVKAGGSFTQGFVSASLLFCVGPLTIVGSIQNGLQGDASGLYVKAALDGIAAMALTGAYGIGVGASAIVVLLLQGGISLAAGSLANLIPNPATDPRVLLLTGAGGLMILGIGVNLMLAGLEFEDRRVRVGSMLPALILAPILYATVDAFA